MNDKSDWNVREDAESSLKQWCVWCFRKESVLRDATRLGDLWVWEKRTESIAETSNWKAKVLWSWEHFIRSKDRWAQSLTYLTIKIAIKPLASAAWSWYRVAEERAYRERRGDTSWTWGTMNLEQSPHWEDLLTWRWDQRHETKFRGGLASQQARIGQLRE